MAEVSKWDEWQLEILKRDYMLTTNTEELAARVGHTAHAVRCKAFQLGLRRCHRKQKQARTVGGFNREVAEQDAARKKGIAEQIEDIEEQLDRTTDLKEMERLLRQRSVLAAKLDKDTTQTAGTSDFNMI